MASSPQNFFSPQAGLPGTWTRQETHNSIARNFAFFVADGGSGDVLPPVVTVDAPAAGPMDPSATIQVTALDARHVNRLTIELTDSTGFTYLAFDGLDESGGKSPFFAAVTPLSTGFQVVITRSTVWPSGTLVATAQATDDAGNSVLATRSWTIGVAPVTATDPEVDAEDLAATAASLVIIQYRDSPVLNAVLAMMAALLQEGENALVTMLKLRDYRNVSVPAGVNLDMTGELVGQERQLRDGTVLDDDPLRDAIDMRIERNGSTATNPDLLAALITLFGGGVTIVYRDFGGMSVGFQISRAPLAAEVSILNEDLPPRAMGVEINPRQYTDAFHTFGFFEDDTATGFGELSDGPQQDGNFAEIF